MNESEIYALSLMDLRTLFSVVEVRPTYSSLAISTVYAGGAFIIQSSTAGKHQVADIPTDLKVPWCEALVVKPLAKCPTELIGLLRKLDYSKFAVVSSGTKHLYAKQIYQAATEALHQ